MGLFDNFVPLDGLLQVIYHSTSCFVLTSHVETASWTVNLGLVGDSGRWWRGCWSEKDVFTFAGSKVSDTALERFATRLASNVIAGELAIGEWIASGGTEIKLQINPTGGAPVTIDLMELPAEEGCAGAINILKSLALQVQSRGCRINDLGPSSSSPIVPTSRGSERSSTKQNDELQIAQERIKRLETEISQAKHAIAEKLTTSPIKHTVPKPPPGASRVNPTRKKRKIVEAEFESD